jgi:hypothetical protein
LLLALFAGLACGKYGPPIRQSEREKPAESEQKDEAPQ